ncbi:RluA family pseudouridine synthase [soil metagenome]
MSEPDPDLQETDDDLEPDEFEAGPFTPAALESLEAVVPDAISAQRIDRVAATLFERYSRTRIQSWIESGRLEVDGVPADARTRLYGGERLLLRPTAGDAELASTPEAIDLDIVFEDETIIVIDKPAGLVVHPGAGNWTGTLLNGLLHHDPALAQVPRAGIVHRLDKDTSGLMVVARTLAAQTSLVRQLQARSVSRRYFAMCWGVPAERFDCDGPIGRDPRARIRMAVTTDGKPALTHVHRLAKGAIDAAPVASLACRLETGRTHQIRVHLADNGHPLVGDAIYLTRSLGKRDQKTVRHALHAFSLAFDHPESGAQVHWMRPLPADLQELWRTAGLPEPDMSADA